MRAIFERSRRESLRLSQVARIQLELAGLRRGRERAVGALGDRCYALLRDGRHAIQEAGPLVEEIAALDRKIAGCEAEVEALRNRGTPQGTARGTTQDPAGQGPINE